MTSAGSSSHDSALKDEDTMELRVALAESPGSAAPPVTSPRRSMQIEQGDHGVRSPRRSLQWARRRSSQAEHRRGSQPERRRSSAYEQGDRSVPLGPARPSMHHTDEERPPVAAPVGPPSLEYSLQGRWTYLIWFWFFIFLDSIIMPIALYYGLWYGTSLSPNTVFSIVTAALGGASILEYVLRFWRLFKKGSTCRVIEGRRSYVRKPHRTRILAQWSNLHPSSTGSTGASPPCGSSSWSS